MPELEFKLPICHSEQREESLIVKTYHVYILSSYSKTLYIGVTNSLERRVYEHKLGIIPSFTSRYHIHKLVYFETHNDIKEAIQREKHLKGWLRKRKLDLIVTTNPNWEDLSLSWRDPSLHSG